MIGFAVVFGLLAVFLANAWLNNRAAEQMRNLAAQQKAAPPAHTIVVASRPLKFGDVLERICVARNIVAGERSAEGRIRQDQRIDGDQARRAHADCGQRAGPRFARSPARASGPRCPPCSSDGMKAVTIRVNDVGGVAGFVLPGDHVDVLLTRPGDKKVSVNDVVIQDARVLAVDQMADDTADKPAVVKAVTLEVDETGGQKLALASMVGTLSLLLRKAGDVADDKTRQVTATDLGKSDRAVRQFRLRHHRGHAAVEGRNLARRIQRTGRARRCDLRPRFRGRRWRMSKSFGGERKKQSEAGRRSGTKMLGTTDSGGEADVNSQYKDQKRGAGARRRSSRRDHLHPGRLVRPGHGCSRRPSRRRWRSCPPRPTRSSSSP